MRRSKFILLLHALKYVLNISLDIIGIIKKEAPGGAGALLGASFDRGRLPTLPLSQYHRRGGV